MNLAQNLGRGTSLCQGLLGQRLRDVRHKWGRRTELGPTAGVPRAGVPRAGHNVIQQQSISRQTVIAASNQQAHSHVALQRTRCASMKPQVAELSDRVAKGFTRSSVASTFLTELAPSSSCLASCVPPDQASLKTCSLMRFASSCRCAVAPKSAMADVGAKV